MLFAVVVCGVYLRSTLAFAHVEVLGLGDIVDGLCEILDVASIYTGDAHAAIKVEI